MINEAERMAAFRANSMAESFLSVLLQDADLSESDEACTGGREARDSGTIYTCPDATYRAALADCDAFRAACLAHDLELVRDAINDPWNLERIGSDLYLERAGHGAGFRDREWSDDRDDSNAIGEAFSALVDSIWNGRTLETYFGDDGQIWICGKERN